MQLFVGFCYSSWEYPKSSHQIEARSETIEQGVASAQALLKSLPAEVSGNSKQFC